MITKSIMLSVKPKWVALILNGKKKIEIRKLFPKDFVGWVYIYCTKEDDLGCIKKIAKDKYVCGKDFDINEFNYLASGYNGKGKVVARFWCDKVEDISYNYRYDFTSVYTDTLDTDDLLYYACLSKQEIRDYLDSNYGYAIHINKLEIFDKPKEISEFYVRSPKGDVKFSGVRGKMLAMKPLNHAPQNYCYVVEE